MVCCAVTLLLAGFFRRLWPFTRRRAVVEHEFAPMARRPVPGTAPAPLPRPAAAVPPRPVRPALIARAAAVGALGYLLVTAGLVLTGAAGSSASGMTWTARTVVLAASAAVVLAQVRPRSAAGRERAGCGLIGAGLAWIELGELDVHLLGLFDLTTTFGHIAFHGAGIGAVVLGAAALTVGKEDDVVRGDGSGAHGYRVDAGGAGDPAVPAGSGLTAAGVL